METNWEFILEEVEGEYYCILCGCEVFGDSNAWKHYHGKRHADSLSLYGNDITDQGDNRYDCNLCDCTISGYRNVRTHVTGQRHDDLLNGSESEASSEDTEDNGATDTEWEFILQEGATSYYCILCGCDVFGETNAKKHYQGNRHSNSLSLYGNDITDQGDNRYDCNLCEYTISGYRNVRNHVTGQRHDDLLNGSESSDEDSSEDSDEVSNYTEMKSEDFIVDSDDSKLQQCIICNVVFENDRWYHGRNLHHSSAMRKYGHDILSSESGWYYCRLCDCKINTYKNVYDHLTGQRHQNCLA